MSKAAAVREPFIRITKRDKMPVWKKIAIYVVAIILALAVSALFIFFKSIRGISYGENLNICCMIYCFNVELHTNIASSYIGKQQKSAQ